jgi:DNA-binding CsgD family transcriptional regulator
MTGNQLHEQRLLAELTNKQRQVLDLLIRHKTSKEIARELGISPHTVDQRIQFAREKLGVRTRSEAAVAYRRLIEICEPATYEDSGIAVAAPEGDEAAQAGVSTREPSSRARMTTGLDHPASRELFEGRHGTLFRLGAIVAIAVLLVLLVLAALATFSQLSQLMGH